MSDKDEENIASKLKESVEKAHWPLLRPHFERGALFLLSKDLELPLVGLAMAQDEIGQVREWLNLNQLIRMNDDLAMEFDHSDTEENTPSFEFLIISPYVIAKKIDIGENN